MSRIERFLSGKTIFITGATGFLGQPLVEKILWSSPSVARIYVLIRARNLTGGRVQGAEERIERELFQSTVFDRLRVRHGDDFLAFLREKVVAVPGDISEDDLGIEKTLQATLHRDVDVVINSAAVVSFDAPVDEALALNVIGAKRVAEFATKCRKAFLVHVSTAYVSGATRGAVPEEIHHNAPDGTSDRFPLRQFLDVELDIAHLKDIIRGVEEEAHRPSLDREFKEALIKRFRSRSGGRKVRRREKIENLRKQWLKNQLTEAGMRWARQRGWNDTYTYTKAMGEQIVLKSRGDLPTVILRPSVIESSLAEPNPGWLDGLRMADPLIIAIGKGRLKSLPLDPDVVLDLVPVDMVVNSLLASLPEIAGSGGLRVYQVATGNCNPITLGELYQYIFEYFTRNPMLDRLGNPIRVRPLKFPTPATFRLQHRLKTIPLGTAERTLNRIPSTTGQKLKRRISATKAAQEKLYYYGEIYEPYLNLNCRFEVTRTLELLNSLNSEERRQFNFDVSCLNWRHYIQNIHIPGVKKHILKVEGAGTLEIGAHVIDNSVRTINELVQRSAELYPHKTALQIRRGDEWEKISYARLKEKAEIVTRRLRLLGLVKGDRVVLYSENQPEWGIVYLGAAGAGIVVVPLDAQTWHREVWATARFTGAKAILLSPDCLKKLQGADLKSNQESQSSLLLLDINADCRPIDPSPPPKDDGRELPAPEVGPDDLASVIFTTGTAVDPKGAMHTHRNFLNNLFGVNHYLPIRPEDNLLSVLPLHHALEFTCGFLMALSGGATVTYVRSMKPRLILETMRETGVTCMLGVPTLYALMRDDVERRILKISKSALKSNLMETSKQLSRSVERAFGRNIGKQLFSKVHQEFGGKIRVFVTGGSALGGELYEDFKAIGLPLYEGYGLTETAPVLTVNPLNLSRRGSAGKPLPGVELRIFHPDRDGIGEIIVKTPSLMTGYYNNPRATERVIQNGWFHTGDLGWVDAAGYLYITGRIKDVIVTGAGKNVYPTDLEAIYKDIPQVEEICVVGVKSGLTEDVHAVIAPRGGLSPGEPARTELKKSIQKELQKIAGELPSYQRLQFIHLVPGPLPRNPGGALDRSAIRAKLMASLGESRETAPPAVTSRHESPEELLLSELSRLTGVPAEEISKESELPELGLDSLMIIEILLFIEHEFQISLPDERASGIRTVGQLLSEVRLQLARRAAPVKTRARGGRVRSTLPYSERPAVDRLLMRLSFSSLQTIYRTYFDLKLENTDRIPAHPPYILAANHCSHLDTGAIISALGVACGVGGAQKLHVLGARDYFFDTPLKGWFFSTFLNVVPIEREEASLAGLRLVKGILSKGEPILIFPEGTRSRTGEVQKFKAGLGLIAWELKVPIVPVYIEGTFDAMPVGKSLPRRKQVRVRFGPPLVMEAYNSDGPQLPRDELYRLIVADVRRAIVQMAGAGTPSP